MGIPIPTRPPTVPRRQSMHLNTPRTSPCSLKTVKNRKMKEKEKNEEKRSSYSGMRTMIVKSGHEGRTATWIKRIKIKLPLAHKRCSCSFAR